MSDYIYLDNNATTNLAKEVEESMRDILLPLNPSSIHFYGRKAKNLLTAARSKIASFLKVKPDELIFTSSGTESVNTAIKGIISNYPKSHIITSDIDHACVYNTVWELKNKGQEISYLKVGSYGALKPHQIQEAIKENTKLIILSYVNSETGVVTDVEKIAEIAQNHNIDLVVDAVAILGKELFTIPNGVSAMCFSSHKIHGPKGIGLLYLKKGANFTPILTGGPQEYEKRAGTENITGILGFAKAVELIEKKLPKATKHMQNLRSHFEKNLKQKLPDIIINGKGPRICNTSNICFKNIDAEAMLIKLDQNKICASHGSACSSGSLSPSRVLLNMGINPKSARSSIRFSFSRYNTKKEIDRAIDQIIKIVNSLC